MCHNDDTQRRTPRATHAMAYRRRQAFTLIELVVVVSLILILISAVFVGGPKLINQSRTMQTQSVLVVMRDIIEQFKLERTDNPGIMIISRQGDPSSATPLRSYKDRYGLYPPDELEIFTDAGLPGSGSASGQYKPRTLAPGGYTVVPSASAGSSYGVAMNRYRDGDSVTAPEFENRDLAAMILAIELYGTASKAMLEGITDKNRSPGALDSAQPQPTPVQYLDRNGDGMWTPGEDLQIRYVVDNWGLPLGYMSERDYSYTVTSNNVVSSNHPDWNQASSDMVRLNGGQPIIFSWGANGKEQLTQEVFKDSPTASMITDWMANLRIDNPLNDDNVYAEDALREKLRVGNNP